MSKKVLIAAPVHPILIDWLSVNGYECIVREKISQAEAFQLVKDVTGIITSTRLQLDKALFDAAPMLEWVGRMGSGMEIIDVAYAQNRGINCFGSPDGNANAVAEHAIGMLLGLNKRIIKSNHEIIQGKWLREQNRGSELEGKTVGIIGFGNTGRAFAKKLMGFDVKIFAYDKYSKDDFPAYVTKSIGLERIYEEADIISFHVPLQTDTIHYMNNDFVAKMRKPFLLINTSRGMVVDTMALWQGLQNKKIYGVCMDVFEEEPIDIMNDNLKCVTMQIANLPNAVLTPHIAGYSYEAIYKMSKSLLDKIVRLK